MMHEPPDVRALAAYTARARHHRAIIELANNTLCSRDHTKRDPSRARALQSRDQAERDLQVMEALTGAWHRDLAERRKRHDEREREVRQRLKNLVR